MSQRLSDTTKWFWYLLALHAGYLWSPSRSVTVRTPPNNPATVEAQAKFFQDFFSVQLSPYKIEFGHVCEDPNTWEQRYEKKDFKNHRDMGKVRWGDKKGGYGEHYWDLNHAGHTGNHGDDDYGRNSDDGSYHEDDNNHHSNDPYDEPKEQEHSYDTEEYDPEKTSYDDSGRSKRAHPRINKDKKPQKAFENDEEPKQRKQSRKNREQLQASTTQNVEKYVEEEDSDEEYEPPVKQTKKKERQQHRHREQSHEDQQPREQKNQVVLVVTQKEKDADIQQPQYVPKRQPEVPHYVPYEGGAGVRQHQPPEAHAAASAPRLFLEASTGHVVDRATGQAYVLQPIANRNYN